jgi:hypothetical protein
MRPSYVNYGLRAGLGPLGLALPLLLTACMSATENPPPASPQAGTYRGDHGDMTRQHGFESELILDVNGDFRYFQIDSNTAFFTAKGKWGAIENGMVWKGIARSYLYHGGFKIWDTLASPDTSYIRKLTDSSFERLEVTFDTQYVSILRWVDYHLVPPADLLPEGAFEFGETYRDGVDTTRTDTGLTRLEITRNGQYVQTIFRNGKPVMSDVDAEWFQAGTFLITTGNHHCEYEYEPDFTACSDAPFDYEYVARLDKVESTAFHFWMSSDFTYQPSPYWAKFEKAR